MGMQPKLRFKGFTDDWEKRKLKDMAKYKNGKGHEDKQSETGMLELVNLNSIGIEGGFKHSGKYVDSADDTLLKNDLVMILSDVGHGDLLGRVALIPESNKFVLNQRVALLRPNKTGNSQFLFSYINAHQRYFKSQGAGMSQLNISKSSVENFNDFVPLVEEQKKIGTFLHNLDQLITVNQRKVDLLKKKKTGYLQKLFPKNGQNNPELRFKGFTDAWEKRRLKSMGDFRRVSVDPQKTPNTLFTEYSMPAYDNNKTPNIVLGSTIHSNRLQIGDNVLLINKLNVRQKRVWYVKRAGNNAVSSSEFMPFTSESLKLSFLKQLLLSDKSTKFMENISSGTSNSQKRITPLDISNYLIEKPTDAREQDKIGDFFETLDNLITVNQRKVDLLKKEKKALLQKMFI